MSRQKLIHQKNKDDKYVHKTILDEDTVKLIRPFLQEYNKKIDLVEKLELIHIHVFKVSQNKDLLLKFLKTLAIGFASANFHQSEIKTILILTKSFKDNSVLSEERAKLLDIYNIKSSQK